MVELGEQAAYETGIHGLHPELIKLVGRMRYRTSLRPEHPRALEGSGVARRASWRPSCSLDVQLAKRGGLLHDIGKVLTHEHEGTHVQLGVEVARRYGESAAVINCIAAHHDDVPHESAESVLVQAADAISGVAARARGARRSRPTSSGSPSSRRSPTASRASRRATSIQAGREVRVIVTPGAVDDARRPQLSEKIARRIESELQYPGQIKVVVIRETRAVDFAR